MKTIKYGNHYGDELNELCPICGYDYVHVGETTFPSQEAIPEDEPDEPKLTKSEKNILNILQDHKSTETRGNGRSKSIKSFRL